MQRVLEYSQEPLVSSDIIGNPHIPFLCAFVSSWLTF
jgi:hypothetical protein